MISWCFGCNSSAETKTKVGKKESKEKLISLSEASRISGYVRGHLNFLARIGKLKAEKLGRNWYTNKTWLNELLLQKESEKGELITLSEASKISGYVPGHLNLLARTGELKAEKVGRNWHTKKEWVKEMVKQKKLEKENEKIRKSDLMKSKPEFSQKNISAVSAKKPEPEKNFSPEITRPEICQNNYRQLEINQRNLQTEINYRDRLIASNLEKLDDKISRLPFKPKRELSFAQAVFLVVLLIGALFLYKSEKNYIVEKFKGSNLIQNSEEEKNNSGDVAGEETEKIISRNDVVAVANNRGMVLGEINFQKIQNPSPSFEKFKYINGDLAVGYNGIVAVKPNAITSKKIKWHAIQSEDLDSSSVNARTIEDHSIQGEDINEDAEITAKEITVDNLNANNFVAESMASGNITISQQLAVAGGLDISGDIVPSADISIDLGSMAHRLNNIYSANIHTNSISTAGQAIFNYESPDTTYANASVLINPTHSIADAVLLGAGVGGVEKFRIDEDGDLASQGNISALGAGNNYFAGNVGIGIASPGARLQVDNLRFYTNGAISDAITNTGTNPLIVESPNAIGIKSGNNGFQINYNNSSTGDWIFYGGGTSQIFSVTDTGQGYFASNVGIGTASPGAALDVGGNFLITSAGSITKIAGNTSATLSSSWLNLSNNSGTVSIRNNAGSVNSHLSLEAGTGVGSALVIKAGGSEIMRAVDGNVGIGTTNPQSMLSLDNKNGPQEVWSVRNNGTLYSHLVINPDNVTGWGLLNGTYLALENQEGTQDPQLRMYNVPTSNAAYIKTYSSASSSTKHNMIVQSSGFMQLQTLNSDSIYVATPSLEPYTDNFTGLGKSNVRFSVGYFNNLNASGNVGIGTTNPSAQLDITNNQNGVTSLRIGNNNSGSNAEMRWALNGDAANSYLEHFNSGVTSSAYNMPNSLLLRNDTNAINLAAYGANGTIGFWTGGSSQRMIIDKGGNVGIGVTNPGARLDIQGGPVTSTLGSGVVLQLYQGSSATNRSEIGWKSSANGTQYPAVIGYLTNSVSGGLSSGDIYFATRDVITDTAPSERMRITGSGNVGIGTTNPGNRLEVQGTISNTAGSGLLRLTNNSIPSQAFTLRLDSSDSNFMIDREYNSAWSNALSIIRSSGNVGIGTTSPSENLTVNGGVSFLNGRYIMKNFSGRQKTFLLFSFPKAYTGYANSESFDFDIYDSKDYDHYSAINVIIGRVGEGQVKTWGTSTSSYHVRIKTYDDTDSGNINVYAVTDNYVDYFTLNLKYNRDFNALLGTEVGDNNYVPAGTLVFDSTASTSKWVEGTPSSPTTLTMVGGNIGIGTTNPTSRLHVDGGTASDIYAGKFYTTNAPTSHSFGLYVQAGTDASDKAFMVSNQAATSDLFIIKGNGYVGIGVTNPGAKLTVNGTSRFGTSSDGLAFQTSSGYGEIVGLDIAGSGYNDLSFRTGANSAMYINTSGNVGIGTTAPAAKLEVTGAIMATDFQLPTTTATSAKTINSRSLLPFVTDSYADMFAYKTVTKLEYDTDGNGSWVDGTASDAQVLFDSSQSTYLPLNPSSYKGFRVTVQAGTYLAPTMMVIEQLWTNPNGCTPFNLKIETSSDLSNWTTVKDTTLMTPDSVSSNNNYYVSLAEHSARNYWRISLVRTDSNSNLFSIYNLQLLSNSNMGSGYFRGMPMATRYNKTVDFLGGITSVGSVGIGTTSPGNILDVYQSGNGLSSMTITNPSTAAAAIAELAARNVTGGVNDALRLLAMGTSYTTSGAFVQDSGVISADSNLSGGLSIVARNASGDMRFYTGGSSDSDERMRILSGGKVGIGTTAPAGNLHIDSSATSNVLAKIQNENTLYDTILQIDRSANNRRAATYLSTAGVNTWTYGLLYNGGSANTDFNISTDITTGNSKFTIQTGGNVGIGTTNPDKKFVVSDASVWSKLVSTTSTSYGLMDITNSTNTLRLGIENNAGGGLIAGDTPYNAIIGSVGNYGLQLVTNNAVKMTIDNNGKVGIGTTSPEAFLDVVAGSNSPALRVAGTPADSQIGMNMQLVNLTGSSYKTQILFGQNTLGGNWALGNDISGDKSQNFYLWDEIANTARLFIDGSSGKVGIGNTAPSNLLDVGSTVAGGSASINATEGTEMVTNPITSGGWTLGSDATGAWTITDGVLTKTASAGGLTATAVSDMTSVSIGKIYKVTIVVAAKSGSTLSFTVGGTIGANLVAGTNTSYVVAGTTAKLIINGQGADTTATITSISVKELNSSTGNMTIYGQLDVKGQMLMGESSARPAYSFASSSSTGMAFSSNSGWLSLVSGGTSRLRVSGDGTQIMGSGFLTIGSGSSLYGPSSGTLELRGGYSDVAQTLNIYGGYTSSTNYVNRLRISAAAGSIGLTAESAGATGDANTNIVITPKGSGYTLLNGNVGIGTTSPDSNVHISSSSNSVYSLHVVNGGGSAKGVLINGGNTGSDAYLLRIMDNSNVTPFFTVTDGNSYFENGNVGIGTTNAGHLLTLPAAGSYDNYWDSSGLMKVGNDLYAKRFMDYDNSAYYLDANNTGNSLLVAGKVGIGTTSPSYALTVSGSIKNDTALMDSNGISFASARNILWSGTSDPTASKDLGLSHYGVGIVAVGNGTANDYSGTLISGVIGIGTTNPNSKLEVSGGDIRVTGGSFIDDGTTLDVPDYVFEDGYELLSIDDLRTYIIANRHLPNIPSMDDIKGWAKLSLQDRDMKLLEKIEENTLYDFQQQTSLDGLTSNLQLLSNNELITALSQDVSANSELLEALKNKLAEDPYRARIEDLESKIANLESKYAVLDSDSVQAAGGTVTTEQNKEIVFQDFSVENKEEISTSLSDSFFADNSIYGLVFGGNYSTPEVYNEISVNNSGIDLNSYKLDNAYLTYYIYVEDPSTITDFAVELGNQKDSREIQWNKDKISNLAAGWNRIKLDVADGIKTGTVDWSNLNYMRIYFKFSGLNQVKIGQVKIGVTEIVQMDGQTASNSQFVSLSDSVSSLENQMASANAQLANISTLQSQMDDIKRQNEANYALLLNMEPENMIYKDASGDVDLLGGKLQAEEVSAGIFSVKVIDEEARTIGEAEISAGENSVRINTKAVTETSKIFVTPVDSEPITWSVSEKRTGESFTVKLSQPASEKIKFDWWIVEEKE